MSADDTATARDDFIDAALFLGMHSADDTVRVAAKAFFVRHLDGRVVMSLEQVGRCDDVIWGYSRELQDLYYPFMDHLHTVMDISREGYDRADVHLALSDTDTPRQLPFIDRMLLGQVINRKGLLHTVGPRSAAFDGLPVRTVTDWPVGQPEPTFPEPLERLYRESLALRLPVGTGALSEGA
ncbi:hypothetical protein AQF52_6664 [Streptomyces venezuelae]|uniref:DUF6190 family protein n=1 Tax=Streptomyces gardneri TaxID=66892 RepID=UPI0006BD82EA|nr:DUF6190 family protein [Streptomyces gardneri]ALO12257.1 hypothetical protein AQF52_6664 [Streptomyces venezuelae]QPK49066.1 hypothetical protein H4W23_33465 [Streptomyces gardneri]WRK40559.1 DUF6190 family protein [Streptomyces venezuelae]CUM37154.1 hypothetical protein BN2537_3273 [Streptomyces venezuelae]